MGAVRSAWLVFALAGCGFEISATTDGGVPPDIADPGACATWFDAAWHSRVRLRIDPTLVAGSNDEFPLLVDQLVPGDSGLGTDFVFTAGDGKTRLPYELESYEPPTGHLVAWVKLPHLTTSSDDTKLYLYYGNPLAAPPTDAAAVWSGSYAAVWHLTGKATAASPQMTDSSGHALDATVRGLPTLPMHVPGKIGGAIALDGINDGLDVPSSQLSPMFSYEAWIAETTSTNWHAILNNTPEAGGGYDRWFGGFDDKLEFWDGLEHRVNAMVPLTVWSHVAATFDGTMLRMYRNGVQVDNPVPISAPVRTSPMQIGYTNLTAGEWFNGQLDEVRVSTVPRMPGYVLTSYRNQNDPRAFAARDAPETCP